MSETIKQSTERQSINADKTNNLIGNLVHKPIQMNTGMLFNNYKERGVVNNFSGVSQDETKSKSDLGLDI